VGRRFGGGGGGAVNGNMAAHYSTGHSNINLGQGNMDELNFQPAYMARNLESQRVSNLNFIFKFEFLTWRNGDEISSIDPSLGFSPRWWMPCRRS
jgi:hypothetical protein